MSHARTQIRTALVSVIDQVSRLTGRVVSDPSEIRDAESGPWGEVAVGAEAVTSRMGGNRLTGKILVRQLDVSVMLHVRGKAEAIELSEELLADIDAVIFSNRQLGGLLLTPLTLTTIQPFEPITDGSQPSRSVRVTWTCTYSTTESNPSVVSSQ